MVNRTAEKMEMKEAILSQLTLSSVRGRSKIQNRTRPMTPHTMAHVAESVSVSRQMVQVRICEAIEKIKKIVWAAPRTSRPMASAVWPQGANKTAPASAMLCTQGWARLN